LLPTALSDFVIQTDELVDHILKIMTVVLEHVVFSKVTNVTHITVKDLKPMAWFDTTSQDFIGCHSLIDKTIRETFFTVVFKIFLQYQDDFAVQNAADLRYILIKHTQAL
jgi:hypothetical protein